MSIYDDGDTPLFNELNPEKPERVVVIDETPNVVITNPETRRTLTKIAGVVGAILGAVLVGDIATPAIDLSAWTTPITAVVLWLGSYYGIKVTLPNTPTSNDAGIRKAYSGEITYTDYTDYGSHE